MGWVIYTHNDIATACNVFDDHFMLMEYGKKKKGRGRLRGFLLSFFFFFFLLRFGKKEAGRHLWALYYLVHLSMTPNSVYCRAICRKGCFVRHRVMALAF
ncbi:uncharacterized protein B0T23DRAFT_150328 [Neurospora hispaniola]|uniref:Uncharacterized protein n=1 Tax=Neurospora hispaniola TaxID=588809 RepID=A0AAJ0MS16_9PEZI|nr:hypothetical protein B0T23DRAFT_150328 [Neurospora hispaniola]